ncbi:cell division protein ZapA [Thermoanaerobacterium sp. RBIITD]|uniref:cell division protein ZapA n=1 Tax=Thermoanaerobacterium sp. RBIITD TaxID=1550240 RepID=UPI000BB8DA7B|nr:cell division protein ZapA [Thermoanaerobacterium sp. RBIITD]SNX52821.1 cell division protein ZapA [Thermoanaerobacterium sp. RBIITD]
MDIKKITVNINGNDYILKTDYPEDYIMKLAGHLNEIIAGISENYSKLSTQMILVLAALNITDELFISKEENNALKKQIVSLKSELNNDNDKIKTLSEEIENLRKELEESREELEEYIKTFDDVS